MNKTIYDIHTHDTSRDNAIISLSPQSFKPQPTHYYSVGIHPWGSCDTTPYDIQLLQNVVSHPQVIAIGETGIDRLKGAVIEKQIELLERHIELSEKHHKPLILHVVKATDIILNIYHKHKPTQQWIIHGFRGNEKNALQLLKEGIHLSFGEKFNPKSVEYTPLENMWIESDESTTDINFILNKIAQTKDISTEQLQQSVATRAAKLFFE
ncbi:MAG: TatD family hydrolase [Bacteroidaceae bacterium]|nr:TatD family hydrolase [Bacteroidaceae bacterium]